MAGIASRRRLVLDDSVSISSDDEGEASKSRPPRVAPPRPSMIPRVSLAPAMTRRRSSSRFLVAAPSQSANLNELYKKAIRMNAENRINAANSWNLPFIEHIDKYILEDSDENAVNFTKASCTLDASVKIYSYRVDDVHLTSYKVLANLNRNDKKDEAGTDHDDNSEVDAVAASTSAPKKSSTGSTLENNLANINLNKLDAAFDIDPLFHKMSKAFDEGGAKGLLLANLGVSPNACHVVFDSSREDPATTSSTLVPSRASEPELLDVASLQAKLALLLMNTDITDFALVPQLTTLRNEYATLQAEGFCSDDNVRTIRRYAAREDEEIEADKSIHQEAMERSRCGTVAASALQQTEDDDDNDYAAPDFGGADGDDDDFENFIALDDNGARYSSISFAKDSAEHFETAPEITSTTVSLLDALCSGTEQLFSKDYGMLGNQWAGALHWKTKKQQQQRVIGKKKPSKAKKTKTLVDFSKVDKDLGSLANQKSIQFSQAVLTKHSKTDHLLPLDAGVGLEQLSKLFLRPNAVLKNVTTDGPYKAVGFDMCVQQNTWGDDASSFGGDDDDGPGFCFADDNDETFQLENIRKVEKVCVGHATVAKKVDVKRLKRDLWVEVECKLGVLDEGDKEEDAIEPLILPKTLSFRQTVQEMEQNKSQPDVTLPFYFICMLHLANEKGLSLEGTSLSDFDICMES